MEDRQFQNLFVQADRRRRAGDYRGAVETAKKALALDPDHAQAHAVLALSLLGIRRLPSASLEVGLALALDGNDAFCHFAAAVVRRAERRLDDAWSHCLVAIETDDDKPNGYVLGASIKRMQGEYAAARELLEEAIALGADNVETLVAYAELELSEGNLAAAQKRVDAALAGEPDHHDAHIAAGRIALRRGEVEVAQEHARFVLSKNATDHDALLLWTGVKARKSVLLGMWWRVNSWGMLRSERARLGILIGSFILARFAIILAGALGFESLETALTYGWLAFCAYTWVAPGMFRKMLDREIKTIRLNPDY
jgi:tetratricopeptide (TPR) repeat protein